MHLNQTERLMHDTRSHHIAPAPHQVLTDPTQLAAFIEAWEVAKVAYGEVLKGGVYRSDAELARDGAYRRLLQAGLRIHQMGGTEAVAVVSARLGHCHQQDSTCHFERLWCGLVPAKVH
jgi:hypothetical protein